MRNGALELLAFERFSAVVLLYDDQLAQLHPLKGGEASAALRTVAPAPDGRIVLARTAVLHLGVVMSAEWATHGKPLSRLLVDGKTLAQHCDAFGDVFLDGRVARFAVPRDRFDDLDDQLSNLDELCRAEATRRACRRAKANAGRDCRLFRVEWNRVLVGRDRGAIQCFFGRPAGRLFRPQVD